MSNNLKIEQTQIFLDGSPLGIFGAGHLGRALAFGLLAAGLPPQQLAICRPRSQDTFRQLTEAGLAACVAVCNEVVGRSKILLYVVRPQEYRAIADFAMREDGLLVSFLAGVPLESIPVALAGRQRARVMPSAPDTIRQRNGIAALYPAGNGIVRELLATLGLRVFPLQHEEDMHAFTALGPCLPIVLAYWEGSGRRVDDNALLATAAKYALPDFPAILAWARTVQPQHRSATERDRYVTQTATPGGITEAILQAIDRGQPLLQAFECGIQRSRKIGAL